jgi:predicted amidohydrolase YtcJ
MAPCRSGPMKKYFLALLLWPCSSFAQSPSPEPSASLILTHVTVIDATGAPAKPDMSVYVRNHRILAIRGTGKIAFSGNDSVVDASGKYLIPGLWDMHVHTGQRGFRPGYAAGRRGKGSQLNAANAPVQTNSRQHRRRAQDENSNPSRRSASRTDFSRPSPPERDGPLPSEFN